MCFSTPLWLIGIAALVLGAWSLIDIERDQNPALGFENTGKTGLGSDRYSEKEQSGGHGYGSHCQKI
jgi:hypothetical protein